MLLLDGYDHLAIFVFIMLDSKKLWFYYCQCEPYWDPAAYFLRQFEEWLQVVLPGFCFVFPFALSFSTHPQEGVGRGLRQTGTGTGIYWASTHYTQSLLHWTPYPCSSIISSAIGGSAQPSSHLSWGCVENAAPREFVGACSPGQKTMKHSYREEATVPFNVLFLLFLLFVFERNSL